MPVKATIHAVERSTLVVTAAFTDAAAQPVTPDSIAWRLEDDRGNVVNNRQDQVLAPAESVQIVLTGADLQLNGDTNESELRRLIIDSLYTSSHGAGLSLSDSYEFRVLNTNTVKT